MEKLGFAIKVASEGISTPIICNDGDWTRKIADIRDYLKYFTGLEGTRNTLTFMSFDHGGCFITLLQPLLGRGGDFYSGWIYIPRDINISDAETMDVYSFVKRILNQSSIESSKSEIQEFFSKNYSVKELLPEYKPSGGDSFAKRYTGPRYSMKEIIGTNRYQSYYANYKAVFILDQSKEIKVGREFETLFVDLSDAPIKKAIVISPPSQENLECLGKGTRLYCNETEFLSPIMANEGESLNFTFVRKPYENIFKQCHAPSEDWKLIITSPQEPWKRKIDASMFIICNEKKEPVKGYIIRVNHKDITYHQTILTENECKNVQIEVYANGYEDYIKQNENLTSIEDKRIIHLVRKIKSCNYTVRMKNGEKVDITVASKYLNGRESPLEGYTIVPNSRGQRDKQELELNPWFKGKYFLYGFISCVILVCLISIYMALSSWMDSHEFAWGLPPRKDKVDQQEEYYSRNSDEDETSNNDTIAAVAYMNHNPVWSKDSLEKYHLTQGLYDMMNKYRFSEIVKKIPSVKDCHRLESIIHVSEEMDSVDNIGQKLGKQSYNDENITINKWIKKVQEAKRETMQNTFSNINGEHPSSTTARKSNNYDETGGYSSVGEGSGRGTGEDKEGNRSW